MSVSLGVRLKYFLKKNYFNHTCYRCKGDKSNSMPSPISSRHRLPIMFLKLMLCPPWVHDSQINFVLFTGSALKGKYTELKVNYTINTFNKIARCQWEKGHNLIRA